MARSFYRGPERSLTLFDKLIASHPEIERKGKTMPYTSHNGHMFTYLSKEGVLGIRLSHVDREAFNEKYGTGPYMQFGKVLREYVPIPDDLLEDTEELMKYLKMSYKYIKTLKPKPTKKNK